MLYEELSSYLQEHQPEDREKLVLYEQAAPSLSSVYGLSKALEEALRERVWLKSGGYLVIQPTEALTVIDVNTGKSRGIKSSRTPSGKSTGRRPPRSPASCACATSPASSSLILSIWKRKRPGRS